MKKRLLYFVSLLILATALFVPQSVSADELTVASGTVTSDYVPIEGYNTDSYVHSQIIYPADSLSAMSGKTIESILFYIGTPNTRGAWTSNFEFRLAEVEESSFTSEAWNSASGTLVFSGADLDGTQSTLLIEFDTPFTYNGGNLLIDISSTSKGSWGRSYFTGVTLSGASVEGYNSSSAASASATQRNFLPKITFGYGVVSCANPSNLVISDITSSSAALSWTAGGSETAWEVIVTPAGGESVVSVESTASKSLTGLDPQKQYSVGVRAICSVSDTSKVLRGSFKTACAGIVSLPYREDFESVTGSYALPDCWEGIRYNYYGSTYYPYVYSSSSSSNNGSYCLYFSGGASSSLQIVTLPVVDASLDMNNLRVRFYYKHYYTSSDYGQLTVGTMSDPSNASSFVAQQVLDRVSSYQLADISLENVPNGHRYIAIKYYDGYYSGSAYLDDIEVSAQPACKTPSQIHAVDSLATATSAVIAWAGNASNYEVKVVEGSDTIIRDNVNDAKIVIGDLSPARQYTYTIVVKGICGDQDGNSEIASAVVTFETTCEVPAELPFVDGFERAKGSATVGPKCWDILNANEGTYTYPHVYINNNSTYVHSGNTSLYLVSSDSKYAYAIFPEFNDDLSDAELFFYYKDENVEKSGRLILGSMTDITDESTFDSICEFERSVSWKQGYAEIHFEANSGKRLAFKYGGANNNFYLGIDDVLLRNIPSCRSVQDIRFSSATATTATFVWTPRSSETAWNVRYAVNGSTDTASVAVQTAEVVVPNLAHSSIHSIFIEVQADCGGGDIDADKASAVLSFQTECDKFTLINDSLLFDFESAFLQNNPLAHPCWTNWIEGDTLDLSGNWARSTSNTHNSSNGCLYLNGTRNRLDAIALPLVEIPDDNREVQFFARTSSASYTADTLFVYYNGSTQSLEGAVLLDSIVLTANYSEAPYRYLLPAAPDGLYLIFVANAAGNVYVDDILFDNAPSCLPAYGLQLASVSAKSVAFAWSAGGEEEEWEVEIQGLQYDDANGVYVADAEQAIQIGSVSEPFLIIGGASEGNDEESYDMVPNTTYSLVVKVRAKCGEAEDEKAVWLKRSFDVQTNVVPDAMPFSTGFEQELNAYNEWKFANTTKDSWFIGTATHSGESGEKSLYVSKDGGTTNNYTSSSYCFSWAYRSLRVEESGEYKLSFDWKCNAVYSSSSSPSAGMMVVLVPDSVVPQSSASSSSCTLGEISSFSRSTTAAAAAEKGYILLTNPDGYSSYPALFYGKSDWTSQSFTLEIPTAGDYKLCFAWVNSYTSTYTPAAAVDNIEFSKKNCVDTKNLEIKALCDTSVVLGWKNTHSSYSVNVTSDSVVLFTNSNYADTVLTIDGLSANTLYSFDVTLVGNCDGGVQGDPLEQSVSFTTECNPFSTFSYEEDFDFVSANSLPDCWKASESYVYVASSSSNAYSGSQYLYLYGSDSDNRFAALRKFSLDLNNARLTFRYKHYYSGSTYAHLVVGTMSNLNDMSTFVAMQELDVVTDYTQAIIDFADVPAENKYIVFRLMNGTSAAMVYIDDVVVTDKPSCSLPKGVEIASAGLHDAVLSWSGTADSYHLVLSIGEVQIDSVVAGSSFTLSGLQSSTQYIISSLSIKSVCGEEESDAAVKSNLVFQTECESFATMPWIEGFEGMTVGSATEGPVCWDIVYPAEGDHANAFVNNNSSFVSSGSKSLFFRDGGTGRYVYAVIPEISVALDGYEIVFNYRHESLASSGYLDFGYMTDLSDTASFVSLRSCERSQEWTEVEQDLSSVPSGARLAFRYGGTGSQNWYLGIDDIKIQEIPACAKAQSLQLETVAAHSAVFTWQTEAPNTKVFYSVGDGERQETIVSAPTFTIDGLDAETSYSVRIYVLPICEGDDEALDTVSLTSSFTTPCDPIETLPWVENFNGISSGIPACWDNSEGTSSSYYKWSYNSAGYTGACLMFDSYYNSSGYTNVLVSPDIVLPNEAAELTFMCKNPAGGAFSVLISVDGGARDTVLSNLTSIADWTKQVVDLSEYAGHVVTFYFHGTSNYGPTGAYLYLDDVQVREKPACGGATDLQVNADAQTTSSIGFKWTSEAASFKVSYVSSDGTIIGDEVVSEPNITIGGLESSRGYTFTVDVVAVCSEAAEAVDTLRATLTAATVCETISALPWRETFENCESGSGVLPYCWSRIGSSLVYPYVYSYSSSAYQGTQSLYFSGGGSTVETAIMPEMTADLSNARIRFYYKSSVTGYSNYGKIILGAMSDPLVESTFIAIDTLAQAGSYVEYEHVLSAVPSTHHYLVLRYAGGTSDYGSAYVDNIVVDEIPSCYPARNLHAVDSLATTSSVTIGWNAPAGADESTAYRIIVKEDGVVLNSAAYWSDTTYIITDLASSMTHNLAVEVYTVCDDGVESEVLEGIVAASTLCEPISTLPWSESFETMESYSSVPTVIVAPICWDVLNANDGSYPYIYVRNTDGYNGSDYVRTGSNYLFFHSSSSRDGYAIFPEFSFDLSEKQLTFSYRDEDTSKSGKLYLGYLTDITSETTFVQIGGEFERSTTMVENVEVILPEIPEGARLAFKYCQQSQNYYLGIDDISITAPDDCRKPSAVELGEVGINSAAFSWQGNASEGYNVEVSINGDSVATVVVSDPALTIDTLAANTAYTIDLKIKGFCGDNGESAVREVSFSFTTLCEQIATLPWVENFNGISSGIPACWDNSEVSGSYSNNKWSYNSTGYTGACLMFDSYYNSSGYTNVLVSPDIVLPNEAAELTFMCKNPAGGAFSVLISVDGGERETVLSDLTNIADWTKQEVDLSEYAGHVVTFYFHGTSNCGYGDANLYLDDVQVSKLPNCRNPHDIVVNASTNEAVISWQGDAAQYKVNVKQYVAGEGNKSVITDSIISEPSITMSGLVPATQYQYTVSVQSLCDDDEESEVVSQSLIFHSACEAIAVTADSPWSEDFEDMTSGDMSDVCWEDKHISGSATGLWRVSSAGTTYSPTGGKGVYLNYQSTGNNVILATPLIDVPEAGEYEVHFWFFRNASHASYPNEVLQVWSGASVDTVTAQKIGVLHHGYAGEPQEADGANWYEYSFTLPEAGVQRILFEAVCTNGYAFYLDDIEVRRIPPCHKPAALTVDSVAATEAWLRWEGNAEQYQVVVAVNGSILDTIYNGVVEGSVLHIDSLEVETSYSVAVSVQGLCGEDGNSEMLERSLSFSTTALCPEVKNIRLFSLGENEAVVTWDNGGQESEWHVMVVNTKSSPADTVYNDMWQSRAYSINNLQPNTAYSYRIEVMSVCGDEDFARVVSQTLTFTTKMPAEYTEELALDEEFVVDFDDAEERQKWGFLGEDDTNHFIFGNDVDALVGDAATGLYVTDNDADYEYNVSSNSASAAFRLFSVSADTTDVEVKFEWQANGEVSSYGTVYDYGRAFIAAESEMVEHDASSHNIVAGGTTISGNNDVESIVSLKSESSVTLNNKSAGTWTSVDETITLTHSGTYRLFFMWRNDNSSGYQNPFAVGNISLKVVREAYDSHVSLEDISGNSETDLVIKFIHNGQVYINYHGVIFDSTGKRVEIR